MALLNILPVLITVCGGYFLIRLDGFFIIHPVKTARQMRAAANDRSSYKALALALAGTLGVGNIVGVAFGISVGGAGSLLWMLISAVFAAVIKYCESAISARMKDGEHAGMMYVIKKSFRTLGRPLSYLYALLCLFLSLTMGSALQSASVVRCADRAFDIPPVAIAAILAVLVGALVIGGVKKIESVTALLVPIAGFVYTAMCLAVIFSNATKIPSVAVEIFKGAFSLKGVSGGFFGFVSSRAIREGFARGLLSNEAGAGTSAMAQARGGERRAAHIGLFGMCEVLVDTLLLCAITGLSVLLAADPSSLEGDGMSIVISVMSSVLGEASSTLLFFLIFAFAYSTVICWYYYGCECLYYIFRVKRDAVYCALFIFSSFIGAWLPYEILIYTIDYILLFMCIITLLTLIKNSERIVRLSEESGLLKKSYVRQNAYTERRK